jgi:prepilin-type N-terminal cleavage/methylation domain-containing protein
MSFLALSLLFPDRNRGFTLIELIVTMLAISILSAIALPNLLGQVGKAREVEGKQLLASLASAQQAYFIEKGTFSSSLDDLDSVVASRYFTIPDPDLKSPSAVVQQATAIDAAKQGVRNYSSGVYYNSSAGTFSIISCQSATPDGPATAPDTNTGACAAGDIIQ